MVNAYFGVNVPIEIDPPGRSRFPGPTRQEP